MLEIRMESIGLIRTPFQQSAGTPIQSSASQEAQGSVELFDGYEAGLRDLAGFDRIWLLYWLDRASEARLVVRPYLDIVEHGIFATRSPARPNHIGLSAVRLLGIEGNVLRIAEVDMLDGTPLLDIKPYVPAFDHLPAERIGWYEPRLAAGVPAVADDRFEKKCAGVKTGGAA
jgi:tRNA-Thr(GGU) m(6)t(6)A37 methyltransferase TsaA